MKRNKAIKQLEDSFWLNDIDFIIRTKDNESITYHFNFLTPNSLIESLENVIAIEYTADDVCVFIYEILDNDGGHRVFYERVVSDKDGILISNLIKKNIELVINEDENDKAEA